MNIYLVEDNGNSPGRVYAIFNDREDADSFAEALPEDCNASVEIRTLFYGQPPIRGYNE